MHYENGTLARARPMSHRRRQTVSLVEPSWHTDGFKLSDETNGGSAAIARRLGDRNPSNSSFFFVNARLVTR
jgi:hypothetical protein